MFYLHSSGRTAFSKHCIPSAVYYQAIIDHIVAVNELIGAYIHRRTCVCYHLSIKFKKFSKAAFLSTLSFGTKSRYKRNSGSTHMIKTPVNTWINNILALQLNWLCINTIFHSLISGIFPSIKILQNLLV